MATASSRASATRRIPDPSLLPTSALIDYLRGRGFKVHVQGDRLVVATSRRRHPLGVQALRDELLSRGPEVLACLAAEDELRRLEACLADFVRYSLTFPAVRDDEVEHARFPSLVGIYWQLTSRGAPPTQGEFVGAVARAFGRPEDEAVQARAARAYPSLVRQHHFVVMLRRRFPEVYHSERLDHLGVDVAVREGALVVGLRLAMDTVASREWREVKDQRHPAPAGLPCLDLYARVGERGLGEFWLHHSGHVAEVERFVDETKSRLAADQSAARAAEVAARLVLSAIPDSK